MREAAKAWVAGIVAPLGTVILYFLSQTEAVATMPDEVKLAVGVLVTMVVGGGMGALVYFVPNDSRVTVVQAPAVVAEPPPDPTPPTPEQ
jgi:hypothetical protein